MKKKNFKRHGLLASFVLTLVFASMAIALPSFAESYRVDSLVGGVFSSGTETEKFPVETKAQENEMSPVNSETAAVAPAPSSLSASQLCGVRDDFNRADGTNMGANWTEAAGDFSILGNRAVGTNGSAMSFTGATSGDKACVDVYAAASGGQYGGVYLKWTSAADNLFVKVQDNDSNGNFDRIFLLYDGGFIYNQACQGGFGISSPFTSARLNVYLDGTTLKADIDTNFDNTPDQSYSCAGAPSKSGTRVGLGIFGGTALDNFGIPPSTLTVTKTADTNDGVCDADCSLREAIAAAASGDTINFASPLFDSTQTITLGLGDLQITKNLTINGPGAKLLTVSGNNASRVFFVGSGANVTVAGLTVTQGNGSGASPNTCGGGILVNSATLTLNSSVLTGNSVPFGGACNDGSGLYNRLGTVTIVNSTINNNNGAAGISTNTGTTNIINSTISNNSGRFAGGIGSFQGANNLTNVTVSGNTATNGPGGIQVNGSAFYVRNSIIANSGGSDCVVSFSLNIQHSLVEDGSCGVTNGVNNNRTGDPALGALADNGGPTPTHALLSNSPAINAGNNCVTDLSCSSNNPPFALTTDQRGAGFARKLGSSVDIGAFEFVPSDSTPPVITPTVSGTLGNNGWYVSDVQVSWSVTDGESSVSNQTGCGASSVTTDTAGVTFTCSAQSAGGSNSQSVTVKRDATAPTINFASRTSPNASGWNNTNVAVEWTCADALSGAVGSSVSTIVSTEGANQSVLGICTDNAGNTAQNTQGGINIDKTAPTITFDSRTPAPNSNGWNNTDVSVNWTCADTLSGAVNASVSQTVSTEGANQSALGTCGDLAGNSAQNTQSGINIDKTAPTITFVNRTAPNASGWNNTDVSVNWTCADTLSGAASAGVNQLLTTEGIGQSVTGTCFDLAGNSNSNTQSGISIDKTAPSITLDSRTAPNAAGWNNTNVALVWTCADTLSGAVNASVSQTISSEGVNLSSTGTCVDLAGNSAQDTQTGINIDKTAPTITFDSRTPAANAAGWNNSDVQVNWNCSDVLSGALNPTTTQTVSTEGANQSASGTCTDNAGNTAQNTQTGINIDKTAPAITLDSRTAPNAAGWNNTNVALVWTCADSLSGAINPTAGQTVSTEGANQTATGTCSDLAGNSAADTQSAINIDKTAPVITFDSRTAPNSNGWNNTNVSVNWTCADTLSGAVNSSISQTVSSEGANLSSTGTCVDLAGNSAQNTQTGIKIDKTAPTITFNSRTAPNAAGWNNTNVQVNWTCADTLSGAASAGVNQLLTTEGIGQTASGTCFDLAGNSASNTQTGIKIDKTPPALNPTVMPNPVPLNGTATASANAADALAGISSAVCASVVTTSVGFKSVLCTAVDQAGNSSSANANYQVTYGFTGFFAPVGNLPAANTVAAGSIIDITFSLGGNQGLSVIAAGYPVSSPVACSATLPGTTLEPTAGFGRNAFSYNSFTTRYRYQWQTSPSWAGTCRMFVLKLADGTEHFAKFQFQ